ncbi:hypothetical protein MLD38_018499 [Melastoma candidum]|uniref:Uncharacterized protein n=1 Tax=Melastoma candidum TaxID=119954 RepID=A0ACB9QV36_9MYRT|nr:hypothetical protein MLD38_018499 [Melastoma candidum]
MADHHHESPKFDDPTTVIENVTDHLHSSSSDDDDFDAVVPETMDSCPTPTPTPTSHSNPKVYRLFSGDRPLHHVLGGGMPADVLLWRNKKLSAGALGVATLIWVLFELMEYHLLTFICHGLIVSLAILFLWSNGTTFIHKKPPRIPEVSIPEQSVRQFVSMLRFEINRSIALLREIALGRDIKKFLLVVSGLWVMSKVGSWCNFLTLFYLVFVILHSVPVLYEKHGDKVDPFAEKAMIEMRKHYAVIDAKLLSKIPVGPLKEKKF